MPEENSDTVLDALLAGKPPSGFSLSRRAVLGGSLAVALGNAALSASQPAYAVSNGYVPSADLTVVQGTMKLTHATAAAYLALKNDAAEAGYVISIAEPSGAYRSFARQEDMIENPENHNVIPGVTLAAAGYSSHGYGTALDLVGNNSWVINNCAGYGFVRPIPGDPNHYKFTGQSTPPPGGYTDIGARMAILMKSSDTGNFYLIEDYGWQEVNQIQASHLKQAWGDSILASGTAITTVRDTAIARRDALVNAIKAGLASP